MAKATMTHTGVGRILALFVLLCSLCAGEMLAQPMFQSVTITSPPEGALPTATVLQPYVGGAGVQFTASPSAVIWSIDASSPDQLPTGMSLGASSGVLGGTPAAGTQGSYTIKVRAEYDTSGCGMVCIAYDPDVNTYTLDVVAPQPIQLTTTELDEAYSEQQDYSFQVTWLGGTLPLDFSGTTGLPNGLTIGQTTGLITGTLDVDAHVNSPYSVTIDVVDSTTPTPTTDSVTLDLVVLAQNFVLLTSALPAGEEGVAYTTTTLMATGGTQSYSWTASPLPTGLSVSSAGIVSGTPSVGSDGVYAVYVTVTDSTTPTALTRTTYIQLIIYEAGSNPLSITTSSLPVAMEDEEYDDAVLVATGGTAPYTWSEVGLPNGLELANDTITGSPLEGTAGTHYVNFVVTDDVGEQTSVMLLLVIEQADEDSSGGDGVSLSGSSVDLVGSGCAIRSSASHWLLLALTLVVNSLFIHRRQVIIHRQSDL